MMKNRFQVTYMVSVLSVIGVYYMMERILLSKRIPPNYFALFMVSVMFGGTFYRVLLYLTDRGDNERK